ncbi:cyclic nucleotide-binding domain-containing protein [bacterium]|nr:MAG: cyclic nucleotide-binding domain-containing protein [bacterium]
MRAVEFTAKDAGRVAWMLGRFELFASLSPEQLLKLAPFVVFRDYEEGEVVIEKDDLGDAFFIVYSGEVEVTKPGLLGFEKLVTRLGPGAFFGEMALLLRQPRSASVVCTGPTELFVLMAPDFTRLLEAEPEVGALVKAIAKDRLDSR